MRTRQWIGFLHLNQQAVNGNSNAGGTEALPKCLLLPCFLFWSLSQNWFDSCFLWQQGILASQIHGPPWSTRRGTFLETTKNNQGFGVFSRVHLRVWHWPAGETVLWRRNCEEQRQSMRGFGWMEIASDICALDATSMTCCKEQTVQD
jgi:hypothetical protein